MSSRRKSSSIKENGSGDNTTQNGRSSTKNNACAENKNNLVPVPPDGGWGWVITFSSFMISFLVDGVCFCFGIFFSHYKLYFGGSKGKTALLGAVLNGAYLTLGPVTSALVNKFGCRAVAICGSIMASIAFFLSTYSPSLDVMIVLFGAIGGSGFGLMYLPAIVMVGYYFEKKRAFATGIAVCGSGIGSFVFAPLSDFLLHQYGWKGAMWIMSGMVLNGIVFATFFRPLKVNTVTNTDMKSKYEKEATNNHVAIVITDADEWKLKPLTAQDFMNNERNPIYRCKSVEMGVCAKNDTECLARLAYSQDLRAEKVVKQNHHSHNSKDSLNPLSRKDIFYSGSLRNIPEYKDSRNETEFIKKMIVKERAETDTEKKSVFTKVLHSLSSSFDFSLLKSITFLIYGVSCFLCMFGFFIPFNFLPDLASDLKLSSNEGAILISIIGITNTVTRIVVGFVSDQEWADSLLINNLSLIVGGLATIVVPFLTTFPLLAVYCVVFGAAIASFVSLRSIIMVELMGIENLTNAFGLVVLCQGLSSFIGSPVAGAVSDITGDYDITFYIAGGTIFLAGFICLPLRRISVWEKSRGNRSDVGKDTVIGKNDSSPEEIPMLNARDDGSK